VSAGGTGVVTGSPPNLVVLSNLNKQFGDNSAPLSYATWMGFAIPLMFCNTLAAWAWICLLQAFFITTMPFNKFCMHKKNRLTIFLMKVFLF
jgi:di/tricarboxylate transporter